MEDQSPTLKIIDDTPTEVVEEQVVPEHVHVPERLGGETFEEYKVRRMFSHEINKSNRRGNMIWNSRLNPKEKGVSFKKEK
jgi:hypothetical protein